MKRADMVNKIVETIQQSCGAYEGEILYPPNEYLAEVILRTIEESGMKPPMIQKKVTPYQDEDFQYLQWVSEWES